MHQALIYKGAVKTESVPAPLIDKGKLLIQVVNSCISAGTEMSGVAATGKSPVKTLLEQPEKIRKIANMIRADGLHKVLDQFRFLKESSQPTGYSVSGIVIGIGEGVSGFEIGDAVAASGGGYAYHAEFVLVPENLVVKIPTSVTYEEASTVALGAIALHGTRRLQLSIGEYVVVVGTGILGLIALQILRASGVQVIAVDINEHRLNIAKELGADYIINSGSEDPVKAIENVTRGFMADAVLFAASTSDSKVLSQAFHMCRRKGKVVLMGVSGMELNRKDLYPGENDLLISTSYGPGRYDKQYEEMGVDYPYAYVRWTEGRNFSEYLRLIAEKHIRLNALINNIFPISEAYQAFEALKDKDHKPLIVLLSYDRPEVTHLPNLENKIILKNIPIQKNKKIRVGILGVGNFALSVHIPNLVKLSDQFAIHALASQTGVKALNAGKFYGCKYVTTDYNQIIEDPEIDLVMVCTRHGNHASLVHKTLLAGKHVFVEKPLATNKDDLKLLEDYFIANSSTSPLLITGFNRRFSSYLTEIRKHTLNRVGPLYIHYRMNAGYLPSDHWTHTDGGRLIGEACHIVDLAAFLTNNPVAFIKAGKPKKHSGKFNSGDTATLLIGYEDGSLATLEYVAMGHRDLPKEYMEVHFDEKSIVLNDYKQLTGYGLRIKNINTRTSQKGHLEELKAVYDFLSGKTTEWPIPWWQMLETTKALLQISDAD